MRPVLTHQIKWEIKNCYSSVISCPVWNPNTFCVAYISTYRSSPSETIRRDFRFTIDCGLWQSERQFSMMSSHKHRRITFFPPQRSLTFRRHWPTFSAYELNNREKKNTSRYLFRLSQSSSLGEIIYEHFLLLRSGRHWQNVKAILEECEHTKQKIFPPFIIHFVCLKSSSFSLLCKLAFSGWIK